VSTQGRSQLAAAVREHLNADWSDWDIENALVRGIVDAVRSRLGTVVTAQQVTDAFPTLPPMDDFSTVDLDDSDDVIEKLDPYMCAAEGLPLSFWQECGLEFHERVAAIRCDQNSHSFELGVVTDGATDHWFSFLNTNVASNGYCTPIPSTISARRGEIEEVVLQGDGYLRIVDCVETSLRGADFEWLTLAAESKGARVDPSTGP
jgi:hypothetical protein